MLSILYIREAVQSLITAPYSTLNSSSEYSVLLSSGNGKNQLVLLSNVIYFQPFTKSIWLKAWRGIKQWCTTLAHSTFVRMKLKDERDELKADGWFRGRDGTVGGECVCEAAIRSQPYQTHFEVWSFLFSRSFLYLFISWSWYPHTHTHIHIMYTHTHTLQVDFPFQHVWLEALTLGQPYRFPGTAVLSAGCQAGTGKTRKSWGPMHLLQFTGMCQQ